MAQYYDFGTYFAIVDKLLPDNRFISGCKLLKPKKWEGIIFSFEPVNLLKNNETVKDKVPIEVDFRILHNPQNISDEELNSPEFIKLTENILNHIVKECAQ